MIELLIIQNYNANKGDASVISAMLDSLRSIPDVRLSLTSYDPENARRDYGVPAEEFLCNGRSIKLSRGMGRVWALIREFLFIAYFPLWYVAARCGVRLPLSAKRERIIELYRKADVVVLPGGHFFTSFNGVFTHISHTIGMFAAFGLRKKTMIYAQTLGPFWGGKGRLEEWMMKMVLKRTTMITVRDHQSIVHYAACAPTMRQTAEIVFAYPTAPPTETVRSVLEKARRGGRRILAVTIHHIYFRHFFPEEEYIARMAGALRCAVEEFDMDLLMIPMEDSMHSGGDRPLIRRILLAAGIASDRAFLPEEELSSSETASLIAGADFFAGTKTHSVVYGLKGGVPTIGIVYQEKTRAFMTLFGQDAYAIDLKDLTAEAFADRLRMVCGEAENIRLALRVQYDRIRDMALENNDCLRTLF